MTFEYFHTIILEIALLYGNELSTGLCYSFSE